MHLASLGLTPSPFNRMPKERPNSRHHLTASKTVPAVAYPFEGEFRPEHFRGVATVVLKLLPADIALLEQRSTVMIGM
jgi:pantothenate synthetase